MAVLAPQMSGDSHNFSHTNVAAGFSRRAKVAFISLVFGAEGKVAANHHPRTSVPPSHLASRALDGAPFEIQIQT